MPAHHINCFFLFFILWSVSCIAFIWFGSVAATLSCHESNQREETIDKDFVGYEHFDSRDMAMEQIPITGGRPLRSVVLHCLSV
ncbi:hypothetical protein C4D60_Mb07t15600 [Musa balbisiana]|uniref:Secreted protein n=1 Tax=Musa balbisiana TaxID=52838 RepID=A0A4S8JFJ3_MUSBA|nr:hypothetical protein C4D60_Mb07t15600 [Musa balbisiana]